MWTMLKILVFMSRTAYQRLINIIQLTVSCTLNHVDTVVITSEHCTAVSKLLSSGLSSALPVPQSGKFLWLWWNEGCRFCFPLLQLSCLHPTSTVLPCPHPPLPVHHLHVYLLTGRGVSWKRGAEEGRELPHASEKRPLLLRARPGSATWGNASFILWVSPAGRSRPVEGREASVQNTVWCPATS